MTSINLSALRSLTFKTHFDCRIIDSRSGVFNSLRSIDISHRSVYRVFLACFYLVRERLA